MLRTATAICWSTPCFFRSLLSRASCSPPLSLVNSAPLASDAKVDRCRDALLQCCSLISNLTIVRLGLLRQGTCNLHYELGAHGSDPICCSSHLPSKLS